MTFTPTGTPPVPPATAPARAAAGWTDTRDRLRAAATTEPGRLRIIGAVLALLVLLFGAVTTWQISDRASAAGDVARQSQPLSADAAEIYRSLADANTTESGGFLVDGQEPLSVTQRYQSDIHTASRLIATASTDSSGSAQAKSQVTLLNEELPVYTGLVETARADNRQGFPLGGAYLRYANDQMTDILLPAAKRLYTVEQDRLGSDYSDAKSLPWGAWGLGLVTLAALGWAQWRTYLRTNRVVNQGLAGASAACLVVLLWLVVGPSIARVDLDDSTAHGAYSLQVLNQARIDSLTARGDENLTLVARGAGDSYQSAYTKDMAALAGPGGSSDGGLLARALAHADDPAGSTPVRTAIASVKQWQARHTVENDADTQGDYDTAVAHVIGGTDTAGHVVTATTARSFDSVDRNLGTAIGHETDELQGSVAGARGALTALPEAAALLCLLGAVGAVAGIGRRLSEYR